MDLLNQALKPDSTPVTPIMITMPLVLLREEFFKGYGDGQLISPQMAMLIAAADKENKYFVIESPTPQEANQGKLPRLWIPKDYHASRAKRKKLKLESELSRQRGYVWDENYNTLCWRFSKLTMLPKSDPVIHMMAINIMGNRWDTTPKYTKEQFESLGAPMKVLDVEAFTEQFNKTYEW